MDNKIIAIVIFLMLIAAVVLGVVNNNKETNQFSIDSAEQEGTSNGMTGEGTKDQPSSDDTEDQMDESHAMGCVVTGCSNHICASGERMTTCEYKDEYSCYADAVCEIQANGECGWTLTEKARACLEDAAVFGNTAI